MTTSAGGAREWLCKHVVVRGSKKLDYDFSSSFEIEYLVVPPPPSPALAVRANRITTRYSTSRAREHHAR